MKTKITPAEVDRILAKLWWDNHTYGQIERLAGITDRLAFWKGKTEDQVREELKAMIRRRIVSGELKKEQP